MAGAISAHWAPGRTFRAPTSAARSSQVARSPASAEEKTASVRPSSNGRPSASRGVAKARTEAATAAAANNEADPRLKIPRARDDARSRSPRPPPRSRPSTARASSRAHRGSAPPHPRRSSRRGRSFVPSLSAAAGVSRSGRGGGLGGRSSPAAERLERGNLLRRERLGRLCAGVERSVPGAVGHDLEVLVGLRLPGRHRDALRRRRARH